MADGNDDEDDVKAISALIAALKPLDPESRVRVLEFVLKKLGISLSTQHAPSSQNPSHDNDAPARPAAPSRKPTLSDFHDIRSFAAEKNPKTVNERVAVVGYYLGHLAPEAERRDYIVADDIRTYFIQAGFELPTAAPQMTLVNAKNAGYLNVSERGQYKLNAVGHNLVAHKLPSGAGDHTVRRSTARKVSAKKPATRKKSKK